MEAIMQLASLVRLLGKQERVRDWHVQNSKAKDTDKTNFLPLTDVECPDE